MTIGLWFFLSVLAVAGVIFAMLALYLDHQKRTNFIHKRYSLTEHADAIRYLKSGRAQGKVTIHIAQNS